MGALFGGLIFSMTMLLYLNTWLEQAFRGYLSDAGLHAIARSVGGAGRGRWWGSMPTRGTRRMILLGIGGLVLAGLTQMLWQTPIQGLTEVQRSTFAIPGPGRHFSRHSRFSAMRSWPKTFSRISLLGAAAVAIDVGLLILVLKLDADYLEGAAAISQKLYERCSERERGEGCALPTSKRAARCGPRSPGWAGPGPWPGDNCCWRCARGWSS